MPTPKRPTPAIDPRTPLVFPLLRCYARDSAFRTALPRLFNEVRPALDEIGVKPMYLEVDGEPVRNNASEPFSLGELPPMLNVSHRAPGDSPAMREAKDRVWDFTRRCKLDCIPEGIDELLVWLGRRYVNANHEAKQFAAPIPGVGYIGKMLLVPDVEREPNFDSPIVRDAAGKMVGTWEPETETFPHAVERFRIAGHGDVRPQLEAIAAAYKACDFDWQDTQPELPRHIRWLYRRLVYREATQGIASQDARTRSDGGVMPEQVQDVTKHLADALHLRLPKPTRTQVFRPFADVRPKNKKEI